MDADELAAYSGLPAPQSHRLIDFDEASVHLPESPPSQPVLHVRGTAPYPGMRITLEPVVFLRQPEFWRIEVVGRLVEPVAPRPTAYQVELGLPGPMGTRGIEVAGAGEVARIVLADDTQPDHPAAPAMLRGMVMDTGGWPLGKVPVVGRSPGRESDIEAIVTTDTEGRYTMRLPGPGRYRISTEAAGFADSLAEIEVRAGVPARQDFYLTLLPALRDFVPEEHPATVEEPVDVPAEQAVPGAGPVMPGTEPEQAVPGTEPEQAVPGTEPEQAVPGTEPVSGSDDGGDQAVEPVGDVQEDQDSGPEMADGGSSAPKRARKAGGASEATPRPRSRRRHTS